MEYILSQLEHGNIQEASFRCFLDDLESTPFGNDASLICDKLFLMVERNLTLPEECIEEAAALDSAIRKLVFNLTDEGIPRIVDLLNTVEKQRCENNATSVEMFLYKALVARCEFHPIFRNDGIESIADRCHKTIIQLGQSIDTKLERTQIVVIDAILGFASYATDYQMSVCSWDFDLPGHLYRFLCYLGRRSQNAIDQKIPEYNLRRDILFFIKDLDRNS